MPADSVTSTKMDSAKHITEYWHKKIKIKTLGVKKLKRKILLLQYNFDIDCLF